MKQTLGKRLLDLRQINERIGRDPAAFIEEEDRRYLDEVAALTEALAAGRRGRCLVMFSGPSSAGKTTTAMTLRDSLREQGVDAHTVSLDDFYRGRELAPVLEDGSYDYEALEALDLAELQRCMAELLGQGCSMLPRFDFTTGRPAPEKHRLCISRDSVVIFEGIHALNPVFEQRLPREQLFKVFVNTLTPICDGSDKLLARRDLRLARRLLRDERFRSSPAENTLHMWQQVVRGERLYMFPYVDTVDFLIDTTHAYEPCVLGREVLPLLRDVPEDNPYYDTVRHLMQALERFDTADPAILPRRALLREFIGGGIYA